MPIYHYQALDSSGKKRKGYIEASSEREAKETLRAQDCMVTRIGVKTETSSKGQLKGENLVSFTMQLSQLVNAGIPLYESLMAIEEQYRQESYHRIILSLCEQIKSGSSLSVAMNAYPQSFDKLYRAMITAGESSGALDAVLDKLSHLLRKQLKLKKQLTTAMIYPGILASFSLLIIILLLGFVVPSIEGIFAERQLNGFTELVISISHFFRDFWWFYIPGLILAACYLTYKARSPEGKLWMECNLIRLPLLKTLIVQTSIGRFCRTMATLQQGGLPMIDSLQIARGVMHNAVLENEIKKAEQRIIEGSSLSLQLSNSKWFPLLVSRMLSVGEESGNAAVMMNKIADIYEDEVEKTIDRLMALSQPVILIFMGTIIGFVLLAILLPLTDMSSFTI